MIFWHLNITLRLLTFINHFFIPKKIHQFNKFFKTCLIILTKMPHWHITIHTLYTDSVWFHETHGSYGCFKSANQVRHIRLPQLQCTNAGLNDTYGRVSPIPQSMLHLKWSCLCITLMFKLLLKTNSLARVISVCQGHWVLQVCINLFTQFNFRRWHVLSKNKLCGHSYSLSLHTS